MVVHSTVVGQLVSTAKATSVEADVFKDNNNAVATTTVTASVPPPVPLALQSVGTDSVKISWPSVGLGSLESTIDPGTDPWVPVHVKAKLVGDRYEVLVPAGNHCRFYRLR